MQAGIGWGASSAAYDHRCIAGDVRPQRVLGGAALASVTLACAWTLWVNLAGGGYRADVATFADRFAEVSTFANRFEALASRGERLALERPARAVVADAFASLFDPRSSDTTPATFVASAPLVAHDEAAAAPPATVASRPRHARVARSHAVPRAQPARLAARDDDAPPAERPPTIFERLFGRPAPQVLAYAAPDDAGLGTGRSVLAGHYDHQTAVYDISARTVYLPDGTRLEAHSGLGARLDDPSSAHERNRGVTPPTVYDLKPRERLFHGVRALRLIPEDDSKVYGRSGLLAHTFMLGPSGQSNGCVSFRDYPAFLRAYEKGEIKRLAVVARAE